MWNPRTNDWRGLCDKEIECPSAQSTTCQAQLASNFTTSLLPSELNSLKSFFGPSFEGPHPPTLGPQSTSGSFDEVQRAECPAHNFSARPPWPCADDSAPSSRSFSRENSGTLLELDNILRDAGCVSRTASCSRSCSPTHDDPSGICDALRDCTYGEERGWRDEAALPVAIQEELRGAVARMLSAWAFPPSEMDRLLAAGPALRSVRPFHHARLAPPRPFHSPHVTPHVLHADPSLPARRNGL